MANTIKSERLAEMKLRCEGKLVKISRYAIGICDKVITYEKYRSGEVSNGPMRDNLVIIVDGSAYWLSDDIEIWGE